MPSASKFTRLAYYFVAIIISALVILYPPGNVFAYDVFGYYMYLPLKFKYNDLTIQNYELITKIFNDYHASETFYQAVKWDNGNWVLRYPIGLSILYSPFYFIADLIAPHTNYPADGFSKPYQLSVLYGCLLYTLAGLHFIKKSLLHFFSDKASALALIGIAIGTNYLFHTAFHGQGAMSHNLLFTLYAVIIYMSIKWNETYSAKHSIILGICVGFTALCRPSEIISGLIPLLYGVTSIESLKTKTAILLKQKKQLLLFGLSVFCMGLFQLIYYKSASGKFLINPYGSGNPGEGLELFKPHLLAVLFSFRKGWFIYTPLMIFIVFGFIELYRKHRHLFFFALIYTLCNVYIVSSWSCWWFGSCFGNRALVANYAVLSLPLACFMEQALTNKLKYIYLTIFILFVSLNIFQSWQMHKGIIDSTNMSRDYYFSVFLQTTPPTAEQNKLLLKGQSNKEIEEFTEDDKRTHSLNFAILKNYEDQKNALISDSISHSGKHSLITSFSRDSVVEIHEDITRKSYTWIKASVWVYSSAPPENLDACFEIHLTHKNWIFKPVKYKLTPGNFKPNTWNKLEYYYMTPDDLRSTKDKVCIYFINNGKEKIYIDDLMMQSYEPIIDKSVF